MTQRINSSSPSTVCISEVPNQGEMTDLCLNYDEIDLKTRFACAYATVRLSGNEQKLIIGCFKIPLIYDEQQQKIRNCEQTAARYTGDIEAIESCYRMSTKLDTGNRFHLADHHAHALMLALLVSTPDILDMKLKGALKGNAVFCFSTGSNTISCKTGRQVNTHILRILGVHDCLKM